MMRYPRRAAGAMLALLLTAVAGGTRPAAACACGAMIAETEISVGDERAIVRTDHGRETILMGLGVESVTRDAALVLPTPTPATVKRADPEVFDDLEAVSAPKVEYHDDWWPDNLVYPGPGSSDARPPADDGVDVLDQSRVGKFEVATLAADDRDALADWLDGHGYQLDPAIEDALRPYVEEQWSYVAVKLASGEEQRLNGDLEPVRVDFDSHELVYPMRLSAAAERTQNVRLYLLGEHRMQRTDAATATPARTAYAGRVRDTDVSSAAAADLIGREGAYLTTLDHTIPDPSRITSDFRFGRADSDAGHRDVRTVDSPVYIFGVAGGPFVVGVAVLVLVLGAVLVAVVFRVRRRRPEPVGGITRG